MICRITTRKPTRTCPFKPEAACNVPTFVACSSVDCAVWVEAVAGKYGREVQCKAVVVELEEITARVGNI